MARVACQILGAQHLHSRGFRGRGQIVGLCDTGLDIGRVQGLHPAFRDKVFMFTSYGRNRADDPVGHGTHVAGCIVGEGPTSVDGPMVGAAPEARLLVQSVFASPQNPFGNRPPRAQGMRRILLDAYKEGARIHSNSWVHQLGGNSYTVQARAIDQCVHDDHRDYVVVMAAGNEGRYPRLGDPPMNSTIRSPATAKNCISVGASENDRPDLDDRYRRFFPSSLHSRIHPGILDDSWADQQDTVTPFSGRGPARSRRIKPDLVAPGTAILSARTQQASVDTFWGNPPDPLYTLLGGTSTATPLVAGCAALVRQYLIQEEAIAQPSAALVKAVLINGAQWIRENVRQDLFTVPQEPTHSQGWGRIDLTASLPDPDLAIKLWLHNEAIALRQDERLRVFMTVTEPGQPFRATLVWTDPPGPRLSSDLDLRVEQENGQERHGNQPPGSTAFDRQNNVERVVWTSMPMGRVAVSVQAHQVSTASQTFALVVAGAIALDTVVVQPP